jgi:hypothetical protein
MRTIEEHKVNPANDLLTIQVVDAAGPGGASHLYVISGFNTQSNPSEPIGPTTLTPLLFQNGPIAEAGVNGITHEALLAILADRLRGFQGGAYANQYNAAALVHIEAAQAALQARTRDRIERGVEGTHIA